MSVRRGLTGIRGRATANIAAAYQNKNAAGVEPVFQRGANTLFFDSNLARNITAAAGLDIEFKVTVVALKSASPVSYIWQTSSDGITWTNVGADAPTYTRQFSAAENGLRIRVLATQLLRTITSETCVVAVQVVTPDVTGPTVFDTTRIGVAWASVLLSDKSFETQSAGSVKLGRAGTDCLFADTCNTGPNFAPFRIGSAYSSIFSLNPLDLIFAPVSSFPVYTNRAVSYSLVSTEPSNVVSAHSYTTATTLPAGLSLSTSGQLTGTTTITSDAIVNVIVSARHTTTNVVTTKTFQLYLFATTPMFGDSADTSATSAQEILRLNPAAADGVYYINGVPIYCLMSLGGWMLAMKATRGATFNYDSNYWTTPNTLNATDTTRNDADAKFAVFNTHIGAEVLAIWPDLGVTGGPLFTASGWTWRQSIGTSTCLQFFQTYRSLGNPYNFDGYRSNTWGSQPCYQEYGTLLNYGHPSYQARVRWGFVFNNECDSVTSDVYGGIGMSGRYSMSAGSYGSPSFGSMNRNARIEIYVR
jgi:hypothetical protein